MESRNMDIANLDKDKTLQCINNEKIRLERCREALYKYTAEYDDLKREYNDKSTSLEERISCLNDSIHQGGKFIHLCEEHLKEV